jgi:myo-inositol-1(or 4)-monophosphatase
MMNKKLELTKSWLSRIKEIVETELDLGLEISTKSHEYDIVTQVDSKVEEYLVGQIRESFPEDLIIGEEGDYGVSNHEDSNCWFIDPIDGTTNFVKQRDGYCSMISYFEQGVGQFAIIYDIVNDDVYWSLKDSGAFMNNEPLPKQLLMGLNEGLVSVTYNFKDNESFYTKLYESSFGFRYYGSAGLDSIKLFKGQLAALVFHKSEAWDIAPAVIFASELGYKLVDFKGDLITYPSNSEWILTNQKALNELLEIIKLFKF